MTRPQGDTREKKKKSRWPIIVAGAAGIGCLPAFIIMAGVAAIISSMAVPVTMISDSLSRYPGGTWVADQFYQANGREQELSKEEIAEIRGVFDEEMGKKRDIGACFRGAPAVRPVQETLFVASPEERRQIIEYRDARLNYNAKLKQWVRDHDRWERAMWDYNRRLRVARQRHIPAREIPAPPREPERPARPPELPDKSWRLTAAERGGVSASADINPDLISTDAAAVPANTPLRDERGRATPAVNRVIDSVPKGTSEPVARTYLTVAFAGGVTSWKHFIAIMETSGLSTITDEQVPGVALSFFAPEVDLRPYQKAVDAALVSLIMEGQVEGKIQRPLRIFEDCDV